MLLNSVGSFCSILCSNLFWQDYSCGSIVSQPFFFYKYSFQCASSFSHISPPISSHYNLLESFLSLFCSLPLLFHHSVSLSSVITNSHPSVPSLFPPSLPPSRTLVNLTPPPPEDPSTATTVCMFAYMLSIVLQVVTTRRK